MSVGSEFTDWPKLARDRVSGFDSCSPNLLAIRRWAEATWGLTNLGCFGRRPVRAGTTLSSHSWGAALDLRYLEVVGRDVAVDVIFPTLIRNSLEMGISAVHDYIGCRIWRAGRTDDESESEGLWWRPQTPSRANGMGQSWAGYLHIETTISAWEDDRDIDSRF